MAHRRAVCETPRRHVANRALRPFRGGARPRPLGWHRRSPAAPDRDRPRHAAGRRTAQPLQRNRGRQARAGNRRCARAGLRAEPSVERRVRDRPGDDDGGGQVPGGIHPQHVVPSWDLKMLWVTNNAEGRTDGTLTPIDPTTGKPGKNVPVDDPYNMYYTP